MNVFVSATMVERSTTNPPDRYRTMSNYHGMSTFQRIAALGAQMADGRHYTLDAKNLKLSPLERLLTRFILAATSGNAEEFERVLEVELRRLRSAEAADEALSIFGAEAHRAFLGKSVPAAIRWLCCWVETKIAVKLNHFGRLISPVGDPLPTDTLRKLALQMNEGFGGRVSTLPVGFVFFAQFIDHDITLDAVTSLSDVGVNVESIVNLRTPALELDNVYRDGPEGSPYLYDKTRASGYLLTGPGCTDLARNPQGTALIGDPRNDENTFVAQFHLQMILFHNGVRRLIEHTNVDAVFGRHEEEGDFEFARRLVRWHYQWIIVNEYLPLVVDAAPLAAAHAITKVPKLTNPPPPLDSAFAKAAEILAQQTWIDCCGKKHCGTLMPVEFSGAAFRYAHSQVPGRLDINDSLLNHPIFVPRPPAPGAFNPTDKVVDWRRFFSLGGSTPQLARSLDTYLDPQLFQLPFAPAGDDQLLPLRNLIRSERVYRVPRAGTVANALGLPLGVSSDAEAQLAAAEISNVADAPLWFYVLGEAANTGGKLGAIGGLLVAWTLLRLLRCDRDSYVNAPEPWKPVLKVSAAGSFSMEDLLSIAASERLDACPPGSPGAPLGTS
ncbi:MAG: peroxidase family protein [Nannocystaceae bacterium]